MAGGSGTRLWPMSRRAEPKQFQALVGDRSLLRETWERVRPLAEPRDIRVATTRDLADLCLAHLPELTADNLILEPVGRNTGPAIGLAAAVTERADPRAVVATVHADHVIGRPDRFVEALRLAETTVRQRPEELVTIGLSPTWGNPGFGYIKTAAGADHESLAVLPVERFEEKPSPERAAEYAADGRYLWNAGYFVFRADTMLRRIETYAPALHAGLRRIQAALGTPDAQAVIALEYPRFDKLPIDHLVFEPESQAGRVLTIPAALDWDDLGSWRTLREVVAAATGDDLVTRGEVVAVDARRSLVYAADRLVAVLGIEDLIVVDTPDALLVCHASRAEDLKQILERLAESDERR